MLCLWCVLVVLGSVTHKFNVYSETFHPGIHGLQTSALNWKYNSWGAALKVIPVFIKSDV